MTQKQDQKVQLNRFIPYRLNNLAERVSVALSRIYSRDFDVSIPEWRILATLAEQSDMLAKEIAAQTHMDKVKVSRAVNALDRKGCLLKQKDMSDSRAVLLSLNDQGVSLYRSIAEKAIEWEAELLGDLNETDREMLFQLLDHLDARVSDIT